MHPRNEELTPDGLREALRACFDPELGLDLIDAGMVHTIELAEDPDAPGAGIAGVPARHRLRLQLLSGSADADRRAQLEAQISNRLAGIDGLSRVEMEWMAEPVWTPARMTQRGRERLRPGDPAFPILNNPVRQP